MEASTSSLLVLQYTAQSYSWRQYRLWYQVPVPSTGTGAHLLVSTGYQVPGTVPGYVYAGIDHFMYLEYLVLNMESPRDHILLHYITVNRGPSLLL